MDGMTKNLEKKVPKNWNFFRDLMLGRLRSSCEQEFVAEKSGLKIGARLGKIELWKPVLIEI